MKPIFFLISFFVVMINHNSFAEEAWKLEKNKDGVKVWTRKPENSNLKEFKGVGILQTTVDKLVAFFKKTELYSKWMYKIADGGVKMLKKNNENDYYMQIIMSAPLIKSRESITHFVFHQPDATGAVTLTLDAAPDMLPVNDNYVRIQKMKGYWKFVPLPGGKVEVTHQALSSVGGNVPDAFINFAIADAPFSMISKLKEMVK